MKPPWFWLIFPQPFSFVPTYTLWVYVEIIEANFQESDLATWDAGSLKCRFGHKFSLTISTGPTDTLRHSPQLTGQAVEPYTISLTWTNKIQEKSLLFETVKFSLLEVHINPDSIVPRT